MRHHQSDKLQWIFHTSWFSYYLIVSFSIFMFFIFDFDFVIRIIELNWIELDYMDFKFEQLSSMWWTVDINRWRLQFLSAFSIIIWSSLMDQVWSNLWWNIWIEWNWIECLKNRTAKQTNKIDGENKRNGRKWDNSKGTIWAGGLLCSPFVSIECLWDSPKWFSFDHPFCVWVSFRFVFPLVFDEFAAHIAMISELWRIIVKWLLFVLHVEMDAAIFAIPTQPHTHAHTQTHAHKQTDTSTSNPRPSQAANKSWLEHFFQPISRLSFFRQNEFVFRLQSNWKCNEANFENIPHIIFT